MYGLQFDEIQKKDYHQQGRFQLAGAPLVLDGQWDDFIPDTELQAQYVETSACATFGTLNAVETLERRIFGEAKNWSDRFLAQRAGTTPLGNSPHKVAETLRKGGDVFESDWPTAGQDSWEKFYQNPPYELVVDAQTKFRGQYDFGHSWVSTDPTSMKLALQHSPLGVDVQAWGTKDSDGRYRREGASNHWVMCYGYNPGRYWKILDTYDNSRKKLRWDYGFSMVKQYTLSRQVLDNSLWGKAIRWLQQFI